MKRKWNKILNKTSEECERLIVENVGIHFYYHIINELKITVERVVIQNVFNQTIYKWL